MSRRRRATGGVGRAALTAGFAFLMVGSLWQGSRLPAGRRRSVGPDPVPWTGERRDAAGRACLKASTLLSRRARHCADHGDERTLLAMSHVLGALHRYGDDALSTPPEEMVTTLTRLVELLERLERAPRRLPGGGGAGSGRP